MARFKLYSVNGELLGVSAMARKFGLKRDTLKKRLERGWSVEAAIKTPVAERHRYDKTPRK